MDRRSFLKRFVKTAFSLIALATLGSLVYIYPSKSGKKEAFFVPLMDEDELPRRGVRGVNYQYSVEDRTVTNRVYLVATEDGTVAFSPICTHLGCFVNWDNNRKEFICPCHGGKYDMNGGVLKGPPSKPLTRLPLRITGGKVFLGVVV